MGTAQRYRFQAICGFGFGLVCASFFNFYRSSSNDYALPLLTVLIFVLSLGVFFAWCLLFSKITIELLDKVLALALIIIGCGSGLLFLATNDIQDFIALGFLFVSAVLLWFGIRQKSSYLSSKKIWKYSREVIQKPLIYLFLYDISYGIAIGICSSESVLSHSFSPLPTIAIGCALAGAIVFSLFLLSTTPKALDLATRLSLGAIVASLLLLLVIDDSSAAFGVSVALSLGIGIFLFLFMRMAFDLHEMFGLKRFTLMVAFVSFFISLGLGVFIGKQVITENPQVAVIACVLIITLVSLYGLGSNRVWTAKGLQATELDSVADSSSEGLWKKSCTLVAQKAGLSIRETEVFMYLAKGRNASYIEKKLYISNHTVKAHMLKIYRKLDVHTMQELIDVVEQKKEELKEEAK